MVAARLGFEKTMVGTWRATPRSDCMDRLRKHYSHLAEDWFLARKAAWSLSGCMATDSADSSADSEEVGHAYGPERNSVSRMVSKHCKINVETALEVRFCTCPVARTRSCRSTILGSRIVEMEPYFSYVSVALECHNFTARAS